MILDEWQQIHTNEVDHLCWPYCFFLVWLLALQLLLGWFKWSKWERLQTSELESTSWKSSRKLSLPEFAFCLLLSVLISWFEWDSDPSSLIDSLFFNYTGSCCIWKASRVNIWKQKLKCPKVHDGYLLQIYLYPVKYDQSKSQIQLQLHPFLSLGINFGSPDTSTISSSESLSDEISTRFSVGLKFTFFVDVCFEGRLVL